MNDEVIELLMAVINEQPANGVFAKVRRSLFGVLCVFIGKCLHGNSCVIRLILNDLVDSKLGVKDSV